MDNYPLLCPYCQSTLHNSKALEEHVDALHSLRKVSQK